MPDPISRHRLERCSGHGREEASPHVTPAAVLAQQHRKMVEPASAKSDSSLTRPE